MPRYPAISAEERFWLKTEVEPDCVVWTGRVNASGYGVFKLQGRTVLAHRVAYELQVGPIPIGLQIDHLCERKTCVLAEHLEPVTNAENQRRRAARSTACRRGHQYTEESVYMHKGTRHCLTCRAVRDNLRSVAA